MTPGVRKLTLTLHITFSVGWLGSVAGFLALSIAGLTSHDAEVMRGAYLAMNLLGPFVIVPFAFASLLTGLVVSLGTKWGLFRHYWIVAKFLINSIAVVILLLHLRLISYVANAAAERTLLGGDLRGLRIQLVAIAGVALLALLTATTLGVFKPRGMTSYGRRNQPSSETSGETARSILVVSDDPAGKKTPSGLPLRRIALAIISVVVLTIVVLHLAGGGLGRHAHH